MYKYNVTFWGISSPHECFRRRDCVCVMYLQIRTVTSWMYTSQLGRFPRSQGKLSLICISIHD